ncbi:DNA-binding PucR family transcriptional regulator [Bacillus ectoiniformans]|uniref:PucR family transcriptional regulator n=1 Tax=Bacillus ectoiniformans TaxID=1494429 RepID=UPI00195E5CA6|nr:helix-turn-helix domain-containing protein [Bacillus ectoiniformans]MBM7650135.1 DNA-binding PucR family transcriptional regulator [Bacillus ectoiniformans]
MVRATGNYFSNDYDSIEILADRISEELGCPITIEDANHRIIAYSRHEDEVDPVRIATIMGRRVPEHVINSLWKSGAIPKLFEIEDPVIIPRIDQVSLGDRVAISVRKHNEVVGFIWAHPKEEFNEEKLMILEEAAKAVKNQLTQYQKRKKETEKSYQEFFWQLLTGHFDRLRDIDNANLQHKLRLAGPLSVIIFDFVQPIHRSLERQADYLAETIQQLPIVARTYDAAQMILLVKVPEIDQSGHLNKFIKNFTAKINERQQIDGIQAAAGSFAENGLHIQKSYKEALHVLKIKQQFPLAASEIYCYEKLGVFQFIEELAKIRRNTSYKNQTIKKLMKYDNDHHSNLLETIFVFLQFDGNMNEAAKALHVHANTLAYRLKRIAEISEIDLKDANEKITLYLDLLIKQLEESDL